MRGLLAAVVALACMLTIIHPDAALVRAVAQLVEGR